MKEEYKNLSENAKEILKFVGIEKEKDLEITITARDVINRLSERGKLEGRAYGYEVEFYPLNGIIVAENKDKELYFVFSPERIDWKEQGIGLAKRLDEYEYKVGNSILTTISSPQNLSLVRALEYSLPLCG